MHFFLSLRKCNVSAIRNTEYNSIKPLSSNLGEVNYNDLIAGRPQSVMKNPEGKFQLFRIDDAVSARNTHAAIYDALRLLKDL